MSRQVTATVQYNGNELAPATDIKRITLYQDLFGHHEFEVLVPFDNVEGPGVAFFSQAHKKLLGKKLVINLVADKFHFNKGQSFYFEGLITNIEASKDNDYDGSIVVRGYSPDYLLADGVKKRTFIKKSIGDIYKEVLKDCHANILAQEIKPISSAPITFATQYNESNFSFLSRLAAEHGEWLFYDGKRLMLGAPADEEVLFVADGEYNSFAFGMHLKPSRIRMYQYNYLSNKHFQSESSGQQVAGMQNHLYGKFALEQSEATFTDTSHLAAQYPIEAENDLDKEALLMRSNTVADLITFRGHSDNPSIQLGSVLTVSGEGIGSRHITKESFGKYRVISITHEVDAEGNYQNDFVAIPYVAQVPPLNPHYMPTHGSPELAEVIDDKDPKKLGRLRVRYHWPVQNPQHAETDWIRVLTPYSGNGKGQLMKPEVGSQVLIGYQDGLAEQPFVMGNMFHANNQQKASYSPENNSMKGIQTAGGNKFVMQDKEGEQKITISNSNNKGSAIEVNFAGDGSVSIKSNGPISLTAGGDITLTAKKDITLTAENVTINAKQKIAKTAKQIALTGSEKVDLDGKATSIKAGDTMKIAASSSLDVNGGSKASISSGKTKIH